MKLSSSLPIATAATAATIGIAGGATDAHAETLNLPGPIVCSGFNGSSGAKVNRIGMEIDSETMATQVKIDQLVAGWKYPETNTGDPMINILENRVFTDGQGNFFAVFHYPGDNLPTSDSYHHDEGYYFFALDLTTPSPDYISTPQIQLTKLIPNYGNDKGLDIFKTKSPAGKEGVTVTKGPSENGVRFEFNGQSALKYIDTELLANVMQEGLLNLIENDTAVTNEGGIVTIFNRNQQGPFKKTCEINMTDEFSAGGTEPLKYMVNIKGVQYIGIKYYTKTTGPDGSNIYTHYVLFIDPNNATDKSKYIVINDAYYADVVDDEGRFLIQNTKSGRKWLDLTTGKEITFEPPPGWDASEWTGAGSDRVAFVTKFTNQKGQVTRVWTEVLEGKIVLTYLVGEDIANMKQVAMDPSVVESNPDSSGTIDPKAWAAYVCQATKTYFPTVTQPVDPGPEQEDGPDIKDGGNTGDTSNPETSNPEPVIIDAGPVDANKPGDTGADTADAKDGETIADTTPKDAAADSPPASDATDQKDTSLPTDVAVADTTETAEEPNQGEPTEELDTKSGSDDMGVDASGIPISNDAGQPTDTIKQQPGSNGGGCSTANTAREQTGAEAFAIAIAAGMLAAYRQSQSPKARRQQIRDEIEAALK